MTLSAVPSLQNNKPRKGQSAQRTKEDRKEKQYMSDKSGKTINKNIPNILTVARIILVPVFMVALIFPIFQDNITRIVTAVLFIVISFTDMLDGHLARKYNIISDFGKFLDPLADKLLIFGAFVALMVFNRENFLFITLLAFSLFIVLLREFAVTSLRMLCKGEGVIAANMAGKIKTVSQMVFVVAALIEPIVWDAPALTYLSLGVMTFMTVYSGIRYFILYLPRLK